MLRQILCEVIIPSGWVGVMIWFGILCMGVAGLALGVVSERRWRHMRYSELPLLFRALLLAFAINLLLGAIGVIHGLRLAAGALDAEPGAQKAAILAMGFANMLYTPLFACLVSIPYLIFTILSIIRSHKQTSVSIPEEARVSEETTR